MNDSPGSQLNTLCGTRRAEAEATTISNIRERRMQERRQRILTEARRIIAAGGVDALTTRGLAAAAEVTQPTLYNLIGNKDAILEALLSQLAKGFEPPGSWQPECGLLAIEELVAGTAMLYQNSDNFRMMFYLYWRLEDRSWAERSDASLRNILGMACDQLYRKRLLRGEICREDLVDGLFSAYFNPLMQWAVGNAGSELFKHNALKAMWVVLCADAQPRLRRDLLERVACADRALKRLPAAARRPAGSRSQRRSSRQSASS